jgi:hypothetical protein
MTHPDEEIVAEHRVHMNALANALDKIFNPEEQKVCFVLLAAPFSESGRCNYISNGDRSDIVNLMKEMVARFEGQPELTGRA